MYIYANIYIYIHMSQGMFSQAFHDVLFLLFNLPYRSGFLSLICSK